jgi:hypothetical protein
MLGFCMQIESAHRPPHVIADELSRESDLDEATELATELARSLEDQKKKMAQSA